MDERGSVREMHEGLVCVHPVFILCSSRHLSPYTPLSLAYFIMLLVDKVRVSYMYVWNGTANDERRTAGPLPAEFTRQI